jgi:hypothetical protein
VEKEVVKHVANKQAVGFERATSRGKTVMGLASIAILHIQPFTASATESWDHD